MIGSGNLIQTLQAASLINSTTCGLFQWCLGGASASSTRPPSHRRCGSFALRFRPPVPYVPSGDIQPGSFASDDEKELARRKEIAVEMW